MITEHRITGVGSKGEQVDRVEFSYRFMRACGHGVGANPPEFHEHVCTATFLTREDAEYAEAWAIENTCCDTVLFEGAIGLDDDGNEIIGRIRCPNAHHTLQRRRAEEASRP